MSKYKLLAGKHEGEKGLKYVAGDVIESTKDLVAWFGSEKFVKVDDMTVAKFSRPLTPAEEAMQNQIDELQNKLQASYCNESVVSTENRTDPVDTSKIPPAGNSAQLPKGTRRAITNDIMLNLDAMTVRELQALAAENEIDLKSESRKDAIIRMLKTASI